MSIRSVFYFKLCIALLCLATVAVAQTTPATVEGQAVDSSGFAIWDASITLTNTQTQTFEMTTTNEEGNFEIDDLEPGTYRLRASRSGFAPYERMVMLGEGEDLIVTIDMELSAVLQSVVVNGNTILGATPEPSETDVFLSPQTLRVISRTQMDMLGPLAGAAQVLNLAPGARVTGYGNTGATKYTLSLNGLNQGWGGYGGYTASAALGVTFDGIPVVDPATGLWQSATIPQMQMIQDTVVTYGPGDPANRWYTNVGGSVEFTPLQPGNRQHGDLMLTYGRFNQKNAQFDWGSSEYKGWSTIVSGGLGQGNSFRVAPDGFKSPNKNLAFYNKTLKKFGLNTIDFGAYYVHSAGYRSQVIPTTPVAGITMDGTPNTQLYSQQTSGFYSIIPFNSYNKYDTNGMALVHARENIHINDEWQLQNMTWFMDIHRLHDRLANVYNPGPQAYEWNNPHTGTFGDQLQLTHTIRKNVFNFSAYYIHADYNSRNNFYNPAFGGAGGPQIVNIGGRYRSSYFAQNVGAVSLQDAFHPTSKLTITPGIQMNYFSTRFHDGSLQDFTFAPGVITSSHCPVTGLSTPGNTTNQSASCPYYASRSGFTPSINASYQALSWLSFYGGFSEALTGPPLGGGGGLFQKVDPRTYHLQRSKYGQFGFKIHTEGRGLLNNLIYGANLFSIDFSNQLINIELSNGGYIAANGAAHYQGLNYFLDADPARNLHVFVNGALEGAHYKQYVSGDGVNYNGLPVSYVPHSTFNMGATYHVNFLGVPLIPIASYQFVGQQTIFNNVLAAPTRNKMNSYGTMNLGLTATFKHVDLIMNALNVLNKQYNQYIYVTSGGYFATPQGGYNLAYPGAPFTVYGSVRFKF